MVFQLEFSTNMLFSQKNSVSLVTVKTLYLKNILMMVKGVGHIIILQMGGEWLHKGM
jgi:hypothetical protein